MPSSSACTGTATIMTMLAVGRGVVVRSKSRISRWSLRMRRQIKYMPDMHTAATMPYVTPSSTNIFCWRQGVFFPALVNKKNT